MAANFDQRNAQLIVRQSSEGVFIELKTGEGENVWWPHFNFAPNPASGVPLNVGFYGDAQRWPFNPPGNPGMEIGGTGSGCNESEGHFEIRQLHRTNGYVDRLHLLFEQHCGYKVNPALFGEIRIGLPQSPFALGPGSVSWPDGTPAGSRARSVPIDIFAAPGRSTRVQRLSLAGAHPHQFRILSHNCTGVRIDLNGCRARVTFAPTRGGPASAALLVETTQGQRLARLDATGSVGLTSWTLDSEPGDWVGGGVDRIFKPGPDIVAFPNDGNYLYGYVFTQGGATWTAEFGAPAGEVLTEKQYLGATRYGFNGSSPGMSVFGQSRGCNQLTGKFTVHDLKRSAQGDLLRLDLGFTQFCDGSDAPLRGRLRLHAGPDHVRPGAVTSLRVRRAEGRLYLSWLNPSAADLAGVMIRKFRAKNEVAGNPRVGDFAYVGLGQRAVIRNPTPGKPLTLTAYAYDKAGNLAPATTWTG